MKLSCGAVRVRTIIAIVLAMAAVAVVGASGCSPTYVVRAGWEEWQLLQGRRPIDEVVHDLEVPKAERAKLRLVQDAREFARLTLGLDPHDSFTSYAHVASDTLLLVVSAAPEFELTWKTWWFPIVGSVPYKGFFQFNEALEAAEELRKAGYETWVRPTSAFSTLGWLPDPILSTTLDADSVALVETVIHEITHTTYFPAGEARFNESFANFVGHRGAIEFFCRAVQDEQKCRRARDRWYDTRQFGDFFQSVVDPLRALYALDIPADSMRRAKRDILREAAGRFRTEVRPSLRSSVYGRLDPKRMNNAWLLSRVLYYSRLDDFEAVYARFGDLRTSVEAIIEAAGDGSPWEGLDRLAAPVAAR